MKLKALKINTLRLKLCLLITMLACGNAFAQNSGKVLSTPIIVKSWYDNGILRQAIARFAVDEPLKDFSGYCQPDASPALGRATLADGSSYTGFFLLHQPFGAGILISKTGARQSGFFKEGKLVTPYPIEFPAFVGHPEIKPEGGSPIQLRINGKRTGTFWGNDKGGFMMSHDSDFYYTSAIVDNNIAGPIGCYVQWANGNPSGLEGKLRNSYLYSGMLNATELIDGTQAKMQYILDYLASSPNPEIKPFKCKIGNIYEAKFSKGEKEGCVHLVQVKAGDELIFSIKALFHNDEIVNPTWARVEDSKFWKLQVGLVFIDDTEAYSDMLIVNHAISSAKYSLALATPLISDIASEAEKNAYLARVQLRVKNDSIAIAQANALQHAEAQSKNKPVDPPQGIVAKRNPEPIKAGDYIGFTGFVRGGVQKINPYEKWYYVVSADNAKDSYSLIYLDGKKTLFWEHASLREIKFVEKGIPPLYVCSLCHGSGRVLSKEETVAWSYNSLRDKWYHDARFDQVQNINKECPHCNGNKWTKNSN